MWCTDESLSYIYFSNSWRQMISCPKKTSFLCSYIECAWQIENQFNSNPGCAWPMVSCKSRRSSSRSTTNHFSVSAAVQKLAGIRNKNIANIIMASVADSFALFLFWSPKTKTKTTIFFHKIVQCKWLGLCCWLHSAPETNEMYTTFMYECI